MLQDDSAGMAPRVGVVIDTVVQRRVIQTFEDRHADSSSKRV